VRACRRVSRSRAAARLGRSRPSRGRLTRCCRGRDLGGRLLFVLLVEGGEGWRTKERLPGKGIVMTIFLMSLSFSFLFFFYRVGLVMIFRL